MNNQMSAPQQEQQPSLDESEVLPIALEDRQNSALGAVMDFLGLAMMADLTIGMLENVGAMDGGLDMTAITPVVAIEPMPAMDFSIESPMGGLGAPTMPSPSLTA